MNKPVFSIVIPTFNSLELLRRALSSALQQQGVAMEVIVTDDSTTTDIADYVASLGDERLRYFRNQPSLGAVKNWNSGLAKATGQYVILMHHDEAMTGEDYLQRVQRLLDDGCDVVVSDVEVTINGNIKRPHFTTAIKRFFFRHPSLLFFTNAVGPCACVAFKRELIQDFNNQLHWLVDVEWYYRMFKGRHVIYDPQLTIRSIHGHKGQITQELDIISTFAHDKAIILGEYPHHIAIKTMLWTYQHLILNTKKKLGSI
jgi:glycosyltransferase involved in cell wall biosynthesis